MPKTSAGILLFRRKGGSLEVFLVHPGGPFWTRKDAGSWTAPKGEFGEGEDPLEAALREFEEETGHRVDPPFRPLNPVRQKSGKIVSVWAAEGDLDPATLRSNTFEIEWPPRSGRLQRFPEVDRGEWFSLDRAEAKIRPEQRPILAELAELLRRGRL
jgi:predicted NUDIX family NTP pyrophosphohydrolase